MLSKESKRDHLERTRVSRQIGNYAIGGIPMVNHYSDLNLIDIQMTVIHETAHSDLFNHTFLGYLWDRALIICQNSNVDKKVNQRLASFVDQVADNTLLTIEGHACAMEIATLLASGREDQVQPYIYKRPEVYRSAMAKYQTFYFGQHAYKDNLNVLLTYAMIEATAELALDLEVYKQAKKNPTLFSLLEKIDLREVGDKNLTAIAELVKKEALTNNYRKYIEDAGPIGIEFSKAHWEIVKGRSGFFRRNSLSSDQDFRSSFASFIHMFKSYFQKSFCSEYFPEIDFEHEYFGAGKITLLNRFESEIQQFDEKYPSKSITMTYMPTVNIGVELPPIRKYSVTANEVRFDSLCSSLKILGKEKKPVAFVLLPTQENSKYLFTYSTFDFNNPLQIEFGENTACAIVSEVQLTNLAGQFDNKYVIWIGIVQKWKNGRQYRILDNLPLLKGRTFFYLRWFDHSYIKALIKDQGKPDFKRADVGGMSGVECIVVKFKRLTLVSFVPINTVIIPARFRKFPLINGSRNSLTHFETIAAVTILRSDFSRC